MKRAACVVAALAVAGAFVQAQRPPTLVSPDVAGDRTVTFRLYAPKALEVQVTGDWMGPGVEPVRLTKNDAGIWSGTAGPFEPNVYTYSFRVDGLTVPIDPSSRVALPWAGRSANSSFEIASTPPRAWTLRPAVTHGVVHAHEFRSMLQDRQRPYTVYTPPGYDPAGRDVYPLLVLLPGTPGNEADWVNNGLANRIFDNLVADGAMRPMVVLMPRADVMTQTGTRAENFKAFEPLLLQEILPDFEKRYRVEKKPELRAIAGYSLGAELAVSVGLRHPEAFRSIGSFSGSLGEADFEPRLGQQLAAPEGMARTIRLLWIGCGSGDLLLPGNRKLDEVLSQKKVPHTFREIPGYHTNPTFRTELVEFLPLLFRP
jgi:enterochelin esterase family protein